MWLCGLQIWWEGFSFREAVYYLAKRVNISIEDDYKQNNDIKKEKDVLYKLYKDVANEYYKILYSEKGCALTCLAGGKLAMDGQAVYKFATRSVPQAINSTLEKAGLTADDIDLFILHQANKRIIDSIARTLKSDISKFCMNISEAGNMSAASIPVLLDEVNRKKLIKKGDIITLSGFGAGLTYGACIITWE